MGPMIHAEGGSRGPEKPRTKPRRPAGRPGHGGRVQRTEGGGCGQDTGGMLGREQA